MIDSWATGQRFVPTHLSSGQQTSSFTSQDSSKSLEKPFSFASNQATVSTVNIGAPPPTKSLKLGKAAVTDTVSSGDMSIIPEQRLPAAQGYAVMVFGLPPGHRNQLIEHFSRFGPVSVDDNSNLVCGRNYLRLVYREKAAAERAVAENGKVGPEGYIVGCVADHSIEPEHDPLTRGQNIHVSRASDSLFKEHPRAHKTHEDTASWVLHKLSDLIFSWKDV